MPFLLAERARSEGARPTRAVKGSFGHSPKMREVLGRSALDVRNRGLTSRPSGEKGA